MQALSGIDEENMKKTVRTSYFYKICLELIFMNIGTQFSTSLSYHLFEEKSKYNRANLYK